MRRFFRFSAVALLLGATPGAFAHYYGWLPGSSTDSPQSGNRIAIVNLHTNATAGPTNGFQFTTESAEVDPLPPTFSPDGTYAYLAVGGAEKPGVSRDGFVYVFNANEVHRELEIGDGTPTTLQKIQLPSVNGINAVRPTGITISPANNKVIVTDAQFNRVYIWSTISSGPNRGTLDLASQVVLTTPSAPSAAWINKNGTRAYYCTNQVSDGVSVTVQPQVHVVDLTAPTPFVIASVPVPSPTQGPGAFGAIKTIPFTSCSFILKAGAVYTVAQPPGDPEDTIDSDALLYIFSGYAGFSGELLGSQVTLNDPFNIYKLDTATNTLTADGNPRLTVTPAATQVTFPPLLSVYRSGHGSTMIQAAGTTRFEDEDGAPIRTLTPSNDNYVLLNGMLEPEANWYYFGSVSGTDGTALISGTYQPLETTSGFYRVSGHSVLNSTVSFQAGSVRQRSMTALVGFTPYVAGGSSIRYDLTVASADGFFGFNIPNGANVSTARKTQIQRFRLNNVLSYQPQLIQLDIMAGGYTQQPIGKVPLGSQGRLDIANHLLGIHKLGLGADVNHDTVIDATDIEYLILQ
ncbi:MAG TPA: hypothetical protein PKH51_03645 [Candidatus Sumerlaeota bacterium]|nr:hypothetical protein [Candidatus Sumerlaeota bacterium]